MPPQASSAYHDHLEQSLLEQLRRDPQNLKARVELIELYFETDREREFLREAQALHDSLKGRLDSNEWRLVASIGRKFAPSSPLFFDTGGLALSPDSQPTPAARHRRLGESKEYAPLFENLAREYEKLRTGSAFLSEFDRELIRFAGRPSSLFHAQRLSERLGGAQIYVKREDLVPAGGRLLMAVIAQALFAKRLGKQHLVTASRDGQRGVITAAIAARLGLRATVYMDGHDLHRQGTNVFRMWLTGAAVETITDRDRLPGGDIREAALRHWLRDPEHCLPVLGLDAAPAPYPELALDAVSAIGRECRLQVRGQAQRPPDVLVARAGNNADAIGFLHPFLNESAVRLVCVECTAWEEGAGTVMTRQGEVVPVEMDESRRRRAEAILEGLEYPSVEREHRALKASGRVEYGRVTLEETKRAIQDFSRLEGIIPAIQTAQVIAWAAQAAMRLPKDRAVVVNMAERVDKDIWDIGKALGMQF